MNEQDLSIKVTKEDAFYTITGGPEGKRCSNCKNRLGITACGVVRGNIADWGYCEYHNPADFFKIVAHGKYHRLL